MNDELIYRIENADLMGLFVRLVILVFIGLLIYNFKTNPFAFSFFILVGLHGFYVNSISICLEVFNNRIRIRKKYLFIKNTSDIEFNYEDIEFINFNDGHFNPLNLLVYVSGASPKDTLTIKLKNPEKIISERRIGTKSKMLKAIEIIKTKLSKKHSPS